MAGVPGGEVAVFFEEVAQADTETWARQDEKKNGEPGKPGAPSR